MHFFLAEMVLQYILELQELYLDFYGDYLMSCQ